ncbi:efflux RND transporter permease subunit [Telmatocola sphagniphila]|uniref:Efflux RND transporter permease subunit n=1 Tax=Telmatocola sphagniphila TaxID=1123043 RepID=A0A8E6B7H3_9BACT|nr:efflux RND transporter permease subunit [Telmatocola sphagniphila]QVL33298.1 efflux RND transporter permease subunit [Telmatocola sphagniphila]
MISRFFIDRPIFATVLSIFITLTGTIALLFLPIAQYPRITPPGVSVSISYPGASAEEVADAVGAPIEQLVNGVPGMLYMSSQSGNDGSYSLTVTFDIGTDLKTALVMVQNRVTLAMPLLPTAVQNQGITIRKRTPDMLMIVNFISPDGRYDDKYLSNFATIYAKDELLRVDGVSDINIQGQRDYSMRIWLDPQKLASRNMTAIDVAQSLMTQNIDAPAGRIGQPPIDPGQSFQLPLDTIGRLNEIEQFENIVIKIGGSPPILSPMGKLISDIPAVPVVSSIVSSLTPNKNLNTSPANIPLLSGLTAPNPSDNLNASTITLPSSTPIPSTPVSPLTVAAPATTTTNTDTGTLTTTNSNSMTGSEATGGGVGALGLSSGSSTASMPSPSASIVRLKDVARVELGAQNYNTICSFDGRPSVGLGLYQLPGTNALEVAQRVRKRMEELRVNFPDGIDYKIGYDTTTFVADSVNDVIKTLLEALGLVAIVVLIFLQSWRASIIPLLAVPVSIIGTFSMMAALGYSLNNISLFGLVLAIGIVVDDAIVVVENVERWMDLGLSSLEATKKAMDEVTGPIIAVALVLCAVFVPCAFIPGMTGQFFRQFAVTIAVSTLFSTINSLTFSPAIAAILLRPRHAKLDPLAWVMKYTLGWFFWIFNKIFNFGTNSYAWTVGILMRVNLLVILVYIGLLILTVRIFQITPKGFIPQQDQGRLIVNLQLPDSASLERTSAAVALVEKIARETPGVAHTVTNAGMSFLLQANSPNFASMFVVLDPFEKRQKPELRDTAIMTKLRARWAEEVKDGTVTVFGAAPVPGLGVAGGFKFLIQDRAGSGVEVLQEQLDEFVRKIKKVPGMKSATSQFRSKTPQVYLDVDRSKAASLGISFDDINQTLSIYLGSVYVNSYNDFGRHWQVTLQAEGKFRSQMEDISLFQIRNSSGQMVPLSTLVHAQEIGGPISVTRYNLYTAAAVNGNVEVGSDGQAIAAINQLAQDTLPLTMKIEWTELMFMQIRAGSTAIYVFILAVISVFLALSALYESWSLPLAVILVVPLCLLCSVEGVRIAEKDVNIFVQIGLVVLVGLACKNAILIVEFAKQMYDAGHSRYDSTKEASRLRLRPILMTSFAFIFGVMPLLVASGAGAEMRRSLGTAVFSGMLGVTVFGIFMTPVFFYVIQGLSDSRFFSSTRARAITRYLSVGAVGAFGGFAVSGLGRGTILIDCSIGAALGMLLVRLVRGLSVTQILPKNNYEHLPKAAEEK